MATTYDLTKAPNSSYPIENQTGAGYLRKHTFAISDLTTHVAGDAAKVFTIAAGEFVKNVYVRVITASTTGSSTLQVGDSGSATGWSASIDDTTTGVKTCAGANLFTQSGTTPFAVTWVGGKLYSAADYILVTLGSTAPADGVFEIIAEIIPAGVYGSAV